MNEAFANYRVLVAAKGLAEVQRLAGDGEIEGVLRIEERLLVTKTLFQLRVAKMPEQRSLDA